MCRYWKPQMAFLLLVLVACSPKVVPTVKKPVKESPVVVPVKEAKKPVKKFTQAEISILIPFKLNQIDLKTATKSQLDRTDMAIDFYQGIKLGIDSAASLGLNFKLNVFDTRDDNGQLSVLVRKELLKNSNLIIGPVFPEGITYLSNYSIANDLPLVSPLAASKPSDFNNPNLISIVNNIDQHGIEIADYIAKEYQSSNTIVVLINTKKVADEQFAIPIKTQFKTKYPSFIVQEFPSTYAFETKMIKGKRYAVIICSAETGFVGQSISKLYNLSRLRTGSYDINLFGHPNWLKQNYNDDQLQSLNTILSTSYQVDYKSYAVTNFIKKYRKLFNYEPSEYSYKGFDIGFYFGKLIAKHGENYIDFLTKDKYKGLHNSFDFGFDPQYGYYNKSLMLLQYKSYGLTKID